MSALLPSSAIFEKHQIRRLYDDATETWWFSVIDIIGALTQSSDHQSARKYWKVLEGRLAKEGRQLVTDCYQLKMPADDGKMRETDVAKAQTQLENPFVVHGPKTRPESPLPTQNNRSPCFFTTSWISPNMSTS